MMVTQLLGVTLFLLFVLRFVRRAHQEGGRQRVLTWPQATAVLSTERPDLAPATADEYGDTVFYHARLQQPYTFYARGQRYTGDRLAPRLEKVNGLERDLFLKGLRRHEKFAVYFNPDDPRENYLTVGQPLLTYGKQLLYLAYGLLLPAFLWWFGTDGFPHSERLDILALAGVIITLLLQVIYWLALPSFDLSKLLVPARQEDLGAEAQENAARSDGEFPDPLLASLAERPTPRAEQVENGLSLQARKDNNPDRELL